MRKYVYHSPRTPTLRAARQELARWLTALHDVSRTLFPEEAATRPPHLPATSDRPHNRVLGDG